MVGWLFLTFFRKGYVMQKTVQVGKLLPNPYRNYSEYPLDKDRVEQLRRHYEKTGFWGNIVARETSEGYEIAYGHHRLKALQEHYGPRQRVEIIIQDLTNEQMVQMMAQENMEEFRTHAITEAETIEVTIKAAQNGEIMLPKRQQVAQAKNRKKADLEPDQPFSIRQIAEFLNWVKKQGTGVQPNECCRVGFMVYEAIRDGLVTRKQLLGLKRQTARAVVEEALKLRREHEKLAKAKREAAEKAKQEAEEIEDGRKRRAVQKAAENMEQAAEVIEQHIDDAVKTFVNEHVDKLKSGDSGIREVWEDGRKARSDVTGGKETKFKKPHKYVADYAKKLSKTIHPEQEPQKSMLVFFSGDWELTKEDVDKLRVEVEALSERAANFARFLKRWNPERPTPVPKQLLTVG